MNRRQFVGTGLATGAALATGALESSGWAAGKLSANDIVELGPDKIKLSRLAMGTGTFSGRLQRQLGLQGLADMLHYGYDQGLTFWDSSFSYQTHPHLKETLTRIPRERVTIMTKSPARTAEEMRTALDQYRLEAGVDYFDIVLMHSMRNGTWPEERTGLHRFQGHRGGRRIVGEMDSRIDPSGAAISIRQ